MWHDSEPDNPEEDDLEPKFNPATAGEVKLALESDEMVIDIPDAIFNPETTDSAKPLEEEEDTSD